MLVLQAFQEAALAGKEDTVQESFFSVMLWKDLVLRLRTALSLACMTMRIEIQSSGLVGQL